jgi:GLPGLI family protein
MKNLILLFVLFLNSMKLFSQGFEVVYEANNKASLQNPMLKYQFDAIGTFEMIQYSSLIIDGLASHYSKDSIIIFANNLKERVEKLEYSRDIYKDYKNLIWYELSGTYKEGYGLRKKYEKGSLYSVENWKDTGEEKYICGVKCKKSVNGVNIAWYAPSIPFMDGPVEGDFYLRGLVLEFENSLGSWVAKSVKPTIKKVVIPKIEYLENNKSITVPYNQKKLLKGSIMFNSSSKVGQMYYFK